MNGQQLKDTTSLCMSNPDLSTNEDVFVSLETDFDWSKVVVEEPISHSFTKGKRTIEWTTSDVYVPGPNGVKLPIYVELAQQKIWGVGGFWGIGVKPEDRNINNIEGFQIAYPLTSLTTVDNPTKSEKATKHALDQMWNLTVAAMKRFCSVKDKSKRKVPAPTYSAYATAKTGKDWTYAVKPVYDYSSCKDPLTNEKFVDKSKSQRMYIKFTTKGRGSAIRCETKIHGPGDKPISPFKYLSSSGNTVRGIGQPVVRWEGICWGSHGQTSYGASVRLRVSEMNFTPTTDGVVTRRRMLASNTTPAGVVTCDDEATFDG